MPPMTLDKWDGLTPKEHTAFAKDLARQLPDGFTFKSIRAFSLGEQKHQVAQLAFDGATFAFIPGGRVTLGYYADRPWEPTPDELESWESTAAEYGIRRTLRRHIAEVTLRPRKVSLRPFLIETTAAEVGWDPIPLDDPGANVIVREHFRQKDKRARHVTEHRGDSVLRVRRTEDGTLIAERADKSTHGQLNDRLARAGFRFPTSDEWEYACGAGARTLFRWGDHVPCDRYPTDISPEEAEWRRRWVLSRGRLKRPPGGFQSDWDLHRRPNAFGISIASDPYKYELVAEPGVTRGGDGGCTICGGAGFFVGWLTLATPYFEAHSCRRPKTEPILVGYTVGRRVLPLD